MIDAVFDVGADSEGAGADLVGDGVAEGEGIFEDGAGVGFGAVGFAGGGAALLGFFGAGGERCPFGAIGGGRGVEALAGFAN